MNAVEIEEAISALAEEPFDAEGFPFAFLEAFGNKATTIKRLRSGTTNKSDLGGVLQTGNIHLKACPAGEVSATLGALRDSPATTKGKVQFLVATDGVDFEAEDLSSGETAACSYENFSDHFGFFLPLAGISTVKEIRENAFDIKATGRLNRLYVQLLRDNPDWGTADRRNDMNHFMARLIFCFFSEDTDIFSKPDLFTATVEQMAERDGSNIHEIISELFRSMNTKFEVRDAENIARWARPFPYVNGGLFGGTLEVPKFTKIARSYLVHIGNLDWKQINPDIFGSMIQAVADDEERGELGMHYTSVPNILKVLNPLFLDELRDQLEAAGDNARKLLNLRNRLAKIRVFDPACGSGNFLVIAYKEMRAIEAEINRRRGEADLRTVIPITNFRGIELRDFSAEIARLALIIAEYQCDVLYRGQKEAIQDFLPLRVENWITCGNALQLDWLSVCPPTGESVKHRGNDLFVETKPQHEIDFENQGGETYICGNPPYKGTKGQTASQKNDLLRTFSEHEGSFKVLDYVSGWFLKSAEYLAASKGGMALVSTNSICQGNQVPVLWPLIKSIGVEIAFAYTSFKWSNLASNQAGVTVVIVGLKASPKTRRLYVTEQDSIAVKHVENINPYLVPAPDVIVRKQTKPAFGLDEMTLGNQPYEGGFLIFEKDKLEKLNLTSSQSEKLIRKLVGSSEVISGGHRFCLWIHDKHLAEAQGIAEVAGQIEKVRNWRSSSKRAATRALAIRSHQFCEMKSARKSVLVVPIRSSENRDYLPFGLCDHRHTVNNLAYAIYDPNLLSASIIASRLHLVWISVVCGKLETRYSYSNKMGWNTFPLPKLTEKNKADLTKCAEGILLAREAHFPANIADLYDPEKMPANLKAAHDRNDEVVERIYIGRRFKNDTERLEKLFELYTKMTTTTPKKKGARK